MNRFEALNPYDPKAVPGSILKIEDVNFDPETGKQRLIHAFAISAKRYALFTIDSEGRPEVIEGGYSEHGLGQFLNPLDPDSERHELDSSRLAGAGRRGIRLRSIRAGMDATGRR